MFSMFATAEEVTKTGLGEEEQNVQEAEAKETDEVKVRLAKCCSASVLQVHGPADSPLSLCSQQADHSGTDTALYCAPMLIFAVM